ncbi:hypothetical protein JWG39_05115 [Desulforhopalus vacuolatus]|uniref:hypothetical protein n=1 Tax=Desulforhopalus vacuolatus TaxID=40414 RepID=UPI001963DC8C|nr:hypothetical protein [Desulforhopalus vacuolatus]MBM9519199.1 hypothetical protein [Desulforhopalus vacuolatus]
MTNNEEAKLKKRGIMMLLVFLVILGVLFSPIFPGKLHGLDYIDNLFNTISKGSSDFISLQIEENKAFTESTLDQEINMHTDGQAEQFAHQLTASGLTAFASGTTVTLTGSMAEMVASSLADSRTMFDNNGSVVEEKYGFSGREALYNWWTGYAKMVNNLNSKKKFKEAKFLGNLKKRALEPAYNYYGIEARSWKANIMMISLALAFYVFYTVWYGFGILYLFEGIGLKIGDH